MGALPSLKVYLIGSLRNPQVPVLEEWLESRGFDVFADWFSAGERADDSWQAYESAKGHTFEMALQEPAAQNVFAFDKRHLDASDAAVLLLPAGKSGHLELGYMLGKGKPGFIVLEDPIPRWDVMYLFSSGVMRSWDELAEKLKQCECSPMPTCAESPPLPTRFEPSEHERVRTALSRLREVQNRVRNSQGLESDLSNAHWRQLDGWENLSAPRTPTLPSPPWSAGCSWGDRPSYPSTTESTGYQPLVP